MTQTPHLIDLLERNARLKKKLDRIAWVCIAIAALLLLALVWRGV